MISIDIKHGTVLFGKNVGKIPHLVTMNNYPQSLVVKKYVKTLIKIKLNKSNPHAELKDLAIYFNDTEMLKEVIDQHFPELKSELIRLLNFR
jgi:predicted transcriptional regulator